MSDGWVTPSGEVDWWYQKTAAADSVRLLSEISGVFNINIIIIRSHVPMTDVKRKNEDGLKRSTEPGPEVIMAGTSSRRFQRGRVNAKSANARLNEKCTTNVALAAAAKKHHTETNAT